MRSNRRSFEFSSMWPLDLAFALLGFLVITVVVRLLRFDDPRWMYNAWTYLLVVPSVLIFVTMLARTLVPEQVERSIQIGFLVSVAAHLLLMVLAVNVVLFSGVWPDALKEMQRRVRSESQATQFVDSRSQETLKRPDFLKPVEVEMTRPSSTTIAQAVATDARIEQLKNEAIDPVKIEREPIDALRSQGELAKPIVQSLTTKLERPAREPLPKPSNRKINVPKSNVENWSDPAERTLDVLGSRASSTESDRIEAAARPDSSSLSSGSWSSQKDLSRSQSPAIDRNVASLPLPNRPDASLPNMDRFAEAKAPSRARSTSNSSSNSNSKQGGVSRPIEVPPTPESEGKGTSYSDELSTTTVLDRTGSGSRMRSEGALQNSDSDLREGFESVTRASVLVEPGASSLGKPSIANPNSTANASAAIAAASAAARDIELLDRGAPQVDLGRFRRRDAGAAIAKSAVPIPAPAFKQRMRRNSDAVSEDLKAMGPLGPQTEAAIERGLEFLAKYQRSDGSWRLGDFQDNPRLKSDSAATALALLSFQGAGYSHEEFKYQETCKKAIEWLKSIQASNGDLYKPMDDASDRNAWLYSHAIATLALCEAYGMTQDASIREPAQRAVDFLVASQDPNAGGWRYVPRVGSDTSVTGWAMMALKSAELSGLQVPSKTYEAINRWLDGSQASARERFLFRYNWQANTPETMHGKNPTPVMTSVGLLMRLYLGWRRTNPDMVRGSDWLLERPPALGTAESPSRDTYYWYYATQVMFHMGGERWRNWYTTLYPVLIQSQETQGDYRGSWDPGGDIPDAWGSYAGRLYVTTMNLLSLEVTYRHLPIYDATAKE